MSKYKDKIAAGLLSFFTHGLTPQKLAFTFAIGITLGVFPMIGPVTGFCIVAALLFRLNQAALQFVNYLAYPLQIICLIPFYELGALLFKDANFTISFKELKEKFTDNLLEALIELWTATWHAMIAWLIAAPVLMAVLYYISFPIINKIILKKSRNKIPPSSF